MNIIDISWPISPDMTTYRNKKDVMFSGTRFYHVERVRESHIMMGSHTGTHVDAPYHILEHGGGVDHIPLESLIGHAAVIDLTYVEDVITAQDLEQFDLQKGLIILLKTRNSGLTEIAPFEPEFISLDKDAAAYCVERGFKAVGIDYLGIERGQPDHDTHKILLQNNIALIEGLRLFDIEMGYYFFVCLPLLLAGLDAAPARAILLEDF